MIVSLRPVICAAIIAQVSRNRRARRMPDRRDPGCACLPARTAGHVLIECRRHDLQARAHGQGQQAFAAPAISAIDTITCPGTATSPGSGSGWAPDRPVPPGLLGDHRRDPAILAIVLIRSFPRAAGGSPPSPPRKAPLSPFGSAGAGVIGQGVSICLARWVSIHVPTTRSRRPA
jgi:hypothetical protein